MSGPTPILEWHDATTTHPGLGPVDSEGWRYSRRVLLVPAPLPGERARDYWHEYVEGRAVAWCLPSPEFDIEAVEHWELAGDYYEPQPGDVWCELPEAWR